MSDVTADQERARNGLSKGGWCRRETFEEGRNEGGFGTGS